MGRQQMGVERTHEIRPTVADHCCVSLVRVNLLNVFCTREHVHDMIEYRHYCFLGNIAQLSKCQGSVGTLHRSASIQTLVGMLSSRHLAFGPKVWGGWPGTHLEPPRSTQ
jgi:hypothetical protein